MNNSREFKYHGYKGIDANKKILREKNELTTDKKESLERIKKEKEIKKEEEKKNKPKKNIGLMFLYFLMFIISLMAILAIYAAYIEPKILLVREYKVTNSLIPDNFHGVKIVHFSDVHYRTTYNEKEINNLVDTINLLSPDIVIFTGDLLLPEYEYDIVDKEFLTNKLNSITSTLGKYYVTGDEDTILSSDILYNAKFINLDDSHNNIYNLTNDYINIIGSKNTNYKQEVLTTDNDKYNIVISHYPDNYQFNEEADLYLAGHSHNTQIKLPYIDTLVSKSNSQLYDFEYLKVNKTDLFVSGGLGTSYIKMRLGSVPSINLYRLSNK